MSNGITLDGAVELDVIKDNEVINDAIEASRVAGFTQHSEYTTLITLDDLDTGEQIVVAEPFKVVREKIDKALGAREDK